MNYPRRSPYLIFKRMGRDEYVVEHYLYSKSYRLNHKTTVFLRRLDGKHNPYSLLPEYSREHVRQLMKDLKVYDLLAPKKKPLMLGVGSFLYPLIYCYPHKTQKGLAKMWNLLLMVMFIPMFVTGVYLQRKGIYAYMQSKAELYSGMLIGALLGIVFHELSHTCAGLAYNGRLFEIGIGTQYFLPMGYVLMDDSNVKSRRKRIQIDAAGIEMNLLLYGCFMCLSAAGFFEPFVMKLCGAINLAMAIINVLPLSNFDGMKILSVIAGKDNVLKYAKRVIRQRKKYLRKSDRSVGRVAAVIMSFGLAGFQIVLPMLLIYEGISFVMLILM